MSITVRGSVAAEEQAIALMWEYHSAQQEEMPQAEIDRRRAAYLAFFGGTDPLRDCSI